MRSILKDVKKVHGPYERKDGRSHVVLVYLNGKKRTVSYPKFLVEFVVGRALDPHKETIDHIDDDFTNNRWSNLRIIPRGKHTSEDRVTVVEVLTKCVWCSSLAKKRPNQLNHNAKLGKAGPFCTRSCAAKYSREVQLERKEPFSAQPFVPTEERLYKKRTKDGGICVASLVGDGISENDILQYCSKK